MNNEYMARYMAARRACRRAQLIKLLGGACVRCGTTESLEFDHIVPGSQSFRISGKALDKPWTDLLAEVEKCQLLCSSCHRAKSKECGETGGGWNKGMTFAGGWVSRDLISYGHGTAWYYQEKKCKCPDCKLAKRMYRNKEIGYTEVIPGLLAQFG